MSQGVRELQPLSQPKQFWGQLLNFSGNSQQQKKKKEWIYGIFLYLLKMEFNRPGGLSARNLIFNSNYWVGWVGQSNFGWNSYYLQCKQFQLVDSYLITSDEQFLSSAVCCQNIFGFCPISPNPISPKPNFPNPDPNPIPNPIHNPIPNPKHTVTLKLTVNIRRNGIRRNGRTPYFWGKNGSAPSSPFPTPIE